MNEKKQVVQRVRYRLYIRKYGDSRRQEFRDEHTFDTIVELINEYGKWLDDHAMTHDWDIRKEFYWADAQ